MRWKAKQTPASSEAGFLTPKAPKSSLDLGVGDLAARLLLPDVDRIIDACDVALLVIGQVADHGLELHARFDLLCHLLRIERSCRLRCLLDDLNGGVAIERVGLRLEILGAEFRHDVLGLRPLARIRPEGHQRAFRAGTGDRSELLVRNAIGSHERRLDALRAQLPQDQAASVVQPAPIHQVGIGRLDLGYECGEVLVVLVDALKEHLLETLGVEVLARLLGETLAIGRLVVHDGDFLALEILEDVIGCDGALLIVAPTGAEDVPEIALGHRWIGGRRGDHEHAVFLVHLGGRNGDAGIEVANDEFHTIADELVGDRDAFFRVRAIVADEYLDFLTEDAALSIDVLDRLLDAVLELGTEGRAAASDRSGNPQFHLRRSALRESEAEPESEA